MGRGLTQGQPGSRPGRNSGQVGGPGKADGDRQACKLQLWEPRNAQHQPAPVGVSPRLALAAGPRRSVLKLQGGDGLGGRRLRA